MGKDGLVLNDGLGDVLGGHNLSGDNLGNGGGFMDNSGLSNGVSNGRQLRGDLSIGMSLSNGVGKVSTQSVMFNGGRIMSRSSDQSRSQRNGLLGSSSGNGQKGSENEKSLKGKICG